MDRKEARALFWKRPAIWIVLVIFAVEFFAVCFLASFEEIIHTIELPIEEGTVIVSASDEAPDLVQQYIDIQEIEVSSDRSARAMMLKDIPAIAATEECEAVYAADLSRVSEIINASNEQGTYAVLSFPRKMMINDIGDELRRLLGTLYRGEAPADGAKEAVISEKVAKELGLTENNLEGATITLNGTEYRIVAIGGDGKGLLGNDFPDRSDRGTILISYEEGSDLGTCRYDPATWDAFVERAKAYAASYESETLSVEARECDTLLFTCDGDATALTDYLVSNFPKSAVFSKPLFRVVQRANTMMQVMMTLLLLLLPAGLLEALCDAILLGSEKKALASLIYSDGDQRTVKIRTFRRQYWPYWVLCLAAGAVGLGCFVWLVTLGKAGILSVAAILVLKVAFMAFVYGRRGAIRKPKD